MKDFSLPGLFFFDWNAGFGRTYLGTITAVGAFIGINYIFGITGDDGILGAFRHAGIAQNTIIGNLVRQIIPPKTTLLKNRNYFYRPVANKKA